MILGARHEARLRRLLSQFPAVVLVGARQVGRTTLTRNSAARVQGLVTSSDLEDPTEEARLADPKLALESRDGLVVIDEVQHSEGLFRLPCILVDRPSNRAGFLIPGGAGPVLLRQSSESFAGRIVYHELPPFRVDQTGSESIDRLWMRGGLRGLFSRLTKRRAWRGAQPSSGPFASATWQLGITVPATQPVECCRHRALPGSECSDHQFHLDALVAAPLLSRLTPLPPGLRAASRRAEKWR